MNFHHMAFEEGELQQQGTHADQSQKNNHNYNEYQQNDNKGSVYYNQYRQQSDGQGIYIGEMDNSKQHNEQSEEIPGMNEPLSTRHYPFGSYLISPMEDNKGRESAFTPLKTDSLFLFTSSNKLEFRSASPFEKLNYSSPRQNSEGMIQGKCINFNNVEISSEESDNDENVPKNSQLNINKQPANIIMNENKIKCTCTKTNCQKKYCACFASGKFCDDCQCENCDNKGMNIINPNSKKTISIICNCTKSNCTKKYCECFKNGRQCSSHCRCINCINCASNTPNYHNIEHSLIMKEGHMLGNRRMCSIAEIRIEIKNNILYVHTSSGLSINYDSSKHHSSSLNIKKDFLLNETYTPMKAIGRKRTRNIKNESTNIKTPGLSSTAKNNNGNQTRSSNRNSNRKNHSNTNSNNNSNSKYNSNSKRTYSNRKRLDI